MKNTVKMLFLLMLFFNFSCADQTVKMEFMQQLNASIAETYNTELIEINMENERELTVNLNDPKLAERSTLEKRNISLNIGELVKTIQPQGLEIVSGQVHFSTASTMNLVKVERSDAYPMFEN